MVGTTKTTSSIKFWLSATAYIIASLSAFLLTSGGVYTFLFFVIVMGSFYLIAWLFVVITCSIDSKVRYTPILIYLILFVQTIAILFNSSDSGYYGGTCAKNFIQHFLDYASCGRVWLNYDIYKLVLTSYIVALVVFAIDIVRLGPIFDKNSK